MSCSPSLALCGSGAASTSTALALSSDEEDDPVDSSGGLASSSRSTGSQNQNSGSADNAESLLPSTIFSQQNEHVQLLLMVADWIARTSQESGVRTSSSTNARSRAVDDVGATLGELDINDDDDICSDRKRSTQLFRSIRSLISILPCDSHVVDRIREVCADHACSSDSEDQSHHHQSLMPSVTSLFLSCKSPNQVLYYLEVLHCLLLPASEPFTAAAVQFRRDFVAADGVEIILSMLTGDHFSNMFPPLQRTIKTVIVKISKLLYSLVGFTVLRKSEELASQNRVLASGPASSGDNSENLQKDFESQIEIQIENLDSALRSVPACLDETILRQVSAEMVEPMLMKCSNVSQLKGLIPTEKELQALYEMTILENLSFDTILDSDSENEENFNLNCHSERQTVMLSSEALQALTLCFVLNSSLLEKMVLSSIQWNKLIEQTLLKCENRELRLNCYRQILMLSTHVNVQSSCHVVNFFISLLFEQIPKACQENAERSDSFFDLICKLLEFARCLQIQVPKLSQYLSEEIEFLKQIKRNHCETCLAVAEENTYDAVHQTNNGLLSHGKPTNGFYLCGRLNLCRELVSFDDLKTTSDDQSLSKSQELSQLIKDLFCHFLFPATIQLFDVQQTPDSSPQHNTCQNHLITQAEPICDQPMTQNAAFQLLVALAGINFNNYRLVVALLQKYFYTKNVTTISEWEFQPPIGCKPIGGFVGLKNAGATCYMNSVIQQLFMVPEIRKGILKIPGVADDYFESDQAATVACGMGTELSRISSNKCSSPTALSAEHGTEMESGIDSATTSELTSLSSSLSAQLNISKCNSTNVDPRVQYHLDVLKYLQVIFGYLTASQLQFYTPEGFWKHFRFAGEPVNLREQQDALEFLNSIVDSVDEATKHMNKTKSSSSGSFVSQSSVFSSTIGGSFADQKICKDCPHRYSREEPFTTLSVDIRNNQTLKDSLEQYVKGDLLEGDNAYFCEKCGKKVDSVKRMCIKKAPPVLIIQLKRFDYDWERDCAIKFNDYFEFPFQLDIEPYTVDGLAKIEGEIIRDDSFETPPELPSPLTSTIPSASSTGERTSTSRVTSATTSLMSDQLTSEEREIIANLADVESGTDVTRSSSEFIYKLMGVVVHSGQASGGHYNSYIQCRQRDPLSNSQAASAAGKWFKFDDGDVSELQVGEDDESVNELLKSQWFGGDNTSHPSGGTSTGVGTGGSGSGGGDGGSTSFSFEQSSNFNRRGSSIGRRQKRWWNAYLLVYERRSLNEETTDSFGSISKTELKPNSISTAANFSDGYATNSTLSTSGNDFSANGAKPSNELVRSCEAEKNDEQLMPKAIAKAVQRQTILFAHNRVQFMPEYLNFIKNLISHCQQNYLIDLREIRNSSGAKVSVAEDFGIISMQLLCNVMFNTALHTKKPLRGPAIEWSDLVIGLLKHVASTRHWLAENWILKLKNLIGHYVLESPSAEVRQAFVKLLVCLCHFSNFDNTFVSYGGYDDGSRQIRISDCVIYEMAQLMRKDHHVRTAIDSNTASIASLSSPGKQLNHYFHFYLHYASFGPKERMQLLKGGGEIPLAMINLMLDEACSSSTNSHVKYQTSEFAKLYQVVSNLVRGCDLSYYCAVSSGKEVSRELYMQSNPYRDKEMTVGVPVSVALKERLIDETVYVKRIMEECPNSEDTVALVCFLSWENAGFSAAVLTDILWQITFAYSAELKPYLDLLLEVLKIPDSWQHHRIIKSLKGGAQKNKQDSKDGLFETIDKSKTHFARRAYLSIKMLTNLFTWSPSAAEVLRRDGDIRHQWTLVVDWLRSELNRNQFGGPGANTSSNLQFNQHNIQYAWSENNNSTGHVNLSANSNETANGYALERSPSAHFTLQKASELIPRSGTPPASHLSPGVRRVNPPPNTSNSPVEEYDEDDDDDDEDEDEDQYEVEDYDDDVINSTTTTSTETPAEQYTGTADRNDHPEIIMTGGQHTTTITSEPETAEVHSAESVVISEGTTTSPITMTPSLHCQDTISTSTVTSSPNYIEANNNSANKQNVNSVNNNRNVRSSNNDIRTD